MHIKCLGVKVPHLHCNYFQPFLLKPCEYFSHKRPVHGIWLKYDKSSLQNNTSFAGQSQFSCLGFLFSLRKFFSAFLEPNQSIVPSFLTYITPVPGGISFPVNEHFGIFFSLQLFTKKFTKTKKTLLPAYFAFISFASLSVLRRIIMSPFLTIPFTFLLFTLPASLPSSILQRTWTISP